MVDAGQGDDTIIPADDNLRDDILYRFGEAAQVGAHATDGGNDIQGFEIGIDRLILQTTSNQFTNYNTINELLDAADGTDGIDSNGDDLFWVTPIYNYDVATSSHIVDGQPCLC